MFEIFCLMLSVFILRFFALGSLYQSHGDHIDAIQVQFHIFHVHT